MNQIKEHENLNKELIDQFRHLTKTVMSISKEELGKTYFFKKEGDVKKRISNVINDYDKTSKALKAGDFKESKRLIELMKIKAELLIQSFQLVKSIDLMGEEDLKKCWGLTKDEMAENAVEEYNELEKEKDFIKAAREEIEFLKAETKAVRYAKNLTLKKEIDNEK